MRYAYYVVFLYPQFLNLVVYCFAVYAEQTGGFGFVAVGLLQSGDDALALRVLVVQLQDVVGAYLSHRQRQFGGGDLRAAREQHRTLHHVVQFAEVAGP